MTGEVTSLKLFFPFQTHTLNVQSSYEMNRPRRTAELALSMREHSYSKLNVAWTDVFYICSENFFVFSPCLVGLTICAQKGSKTKTGEMSRVHSETERADAGNAPRALIAAQEFPNLWLQVSLTFCITVPRWSPGKSSSPSQLRFSNSPLGRVNLTLKKDRRSCWGKTKVQQMKQPTKMQLMSRLTLKLSLVTLNLVLHPAPLSFDVLILPDPAQKFIEKE